MKRGIRRLLWLGPVVEERLMIDEPAVSMAANRWQSGLIHALESQGVEVNVLGYLPRRVWPRSSIRVESSTRTLRGFGCPVINVGYWNAPFLRDLSCALALRRELRTAGRQEIPYDAALTYNAPPAFALTALWAKKRLGVPWIPIIADSNARKNSIGQPSTLMSMTDGVVYLSWHAFERSRLANKLHLDGGVSKIPAVRGRSDRRIVLYTGSMNEHGGAALLANAFMEVREQGAELWICGKGRNATVERAASRDPRIRVFGAVSESVLAQYATQATLTVNPRPSSIEDNKYNFPSKVLEYLSYGRPVVSTWTAGLSPEYRKVLIIPDGETPSQLAQTIDAVFRWTGDEEETQIRKATEFLASRTWDAQARRLIEWLETLPDHH